MAKFRIEPVLIRDIIEGMLGICCLCGKYRGNVVEDLCLGCRKDLEEVVDYDE